MSAGILSKTESVASVYLAFIRNAFLTMLAYRLRYYTGILTYLLFVTVHYFIWQAVYASRPAGELIHGFTLEQMVTYVAIGWVARSFYFSNLDEELDELVTTGQISNYLIRPIDLQVMLFAQAIGESIFRLIFFSLPIGLVIFSLYPIQPPADLSQFLLFVVSTLMGFFVLAEVNFIIGLVAFYLKSIRGVMRAKYFIVQLASGLLMPLAFFPDWLGLLLKWLPFQAIASIPLQLYLGKLSTSETYSALLIQLLWALSLFVLGRWFWLRAARRLTVQGG